MLHTHLFSRILNCFFVCCVCVKCITLCNYLCSSSSSPFSRFSANLIQNIGEFGAKKYFATIKLLIQFSYFFLCKRTFSGLFFFRISSNDGELPGGHNLGQNICRLFHFLAQYVFTTSKTELDYYYQKSNVRVAKQLKT